MLTYQVKQNEVGLQKILDSGQKQRLAEGLLRQEEALRSIWQHVELRIDQNHPGKNQHLLHLRLLWCKIRHLTDNDINTSNT